MESLALEYDEGQICWLHGALVRPPVVTALRPAPGWVGDERQERLTVILEGAPGEIHALVSELALVLRDAARWVHDGAGRPVYLRITPYAGSEAYRSLVVGGRAALPEHWSEGNARVELAILREDAWESAETWLKTSNRAGEDAGSGLLVHNHHDAGHDNFVEIPATAVRGSLPGRARVQAVFPAGLGDLTCALAPGAAPLLEAEAAQGESATLAADVSGGGYVSKVVSPQPPSALLTWQLNADDLLEWEPGEMLPFARFARAPGPYSDLCVFWRVSALGVCWESERRPLGDALLQELPALDVFHGLRGGHLAPLELALMLSGPGIYRVDVDYVQFFPAARVRRYLARGALNAGGTLDDDGCHALTITQAGGHVVTHAAVGSALALHPGRTQRLVFLHPGAIDAVLQVRVSYRARWQEV